MVTIMGVSVLTVYDGFKKMKEFTKRNGKQRDKWTLPMKMVMVDDALLRELTEVIRGHPSLSSFTLMIISIIRGREGVEK